MSTDATHPAFRVDFDALRGLLTTSPVRAFHGPRPWPTKPREVNQETLSQIPVNCQWTENGIEVYAPAIRVGNVSYVLVVTDDASPGNVAKLVEDGHVLMRAWMNKRGLWAAHKIPVESLAIMAEEVDENDMVIDRATYSLNERHEEYGRILFERALAQAMIAKRDGVLRYWFDAGVMELPELESMRGMR